MSDGTWRGGFPPRDGQYYCRLEGGELELRCWTCQMSGKKKWIAPGGQYIDEPVEWLDVKADPRSR